MRFGDPISGGCGACEVDDRVHVAQMRDGGRLGDERMLGQFVDEVAEGTGCSAASDTTPAASITCASLP